MQQQSTGNKLFTLEGTDESGRPVYSPAPQVQQVCQVVDGFIYVANAEPGRGEITGTLVFSHFIGIPAAATGGCSVSSLLCYQHSTSVSLCFTGDGESELGHIQAALSCGGGSASRPLLVLSCISREDAAGQAERRRTPCVYMAKRLGLVQLANPWMVTLKGRHATLTRSSWDGCCKTLSLVFIQVQDVVAESLSGLLDGISWLLKCSGVKL